LPMMHTLRQAGISCEIYPDPAKIKKQLGRADSLGIPYVAMAGETELANNSMMLKQMSTGTQQLLTPEQAILALKAGEGNQ
ncbi:MAG: histidine--tRNA ligase, partial [Muribaculaceae bacterium]|nr:histidine--tRNA ligase [Muribaculaceae bacterium]